MTNFKNKRLCFFQIAEGNKTAFEAFFEHYYPKLIRFACIYVSSRAQAEDVVSDVLTNLLIHRKRVFTLEHFEAYLYSSVKNKALSYIKREERIASFPMELHQNKPVAKTDLDPYEIFVEKELRNRIHVIVEKFPPKRKLVFQLIKDDGLSYRQVAELMEISERTVEVHLKIAVKALREGIERYLQMEKQNEVMQNL